MLKFTSSVILLVICNLAAYCQVITDRPNFIVIFTDDQTYRAIGYNNPEVITPELDALAKKGVIFQKAFTATPVCVASRASILTGLFPQTNGTVALDQNSFKQNIIKEKKYQTLAHLLKNGGYSTYFSGKSHLCDPKDYGFDFGEETNEYDDQKAFENLTSFITDPNFGAKPFLIWLAPRQPHVPLKPPQKWLDLYQNKNISIEKNFLSSPLKKSVFNQGLPGENFYRDSDYTNNYKNLPAGPPRSEETIKEFSKAYYATISHLDFQIGSLIKALDENGHMENTVLIFLSDNGYFLGNHGLGNKLTMHEESVRVPMFIYWKKLGLKGRSSDALVSSIDVFPTILELAGLPALNYLHGKSILPILKDQSVQINKYVASESVGVGGKTGMGHRMIRSERWKYISTDINEELLFDLSNDPYEKNNLIDDKIYDSDFNLLKEYYQQWRYLVGDKKSIR
jgi:arylsulfatase A-like enzyme